MLLAKSWNYGCTMLDLFLHGFTKSSFAKLFNLDMLKFYATNSLRIMQAISNSNKNLQREKNINGILRGGVR